MGGQATLGFKGKRNDGMFWMSWDDFRQVWDEITVCARSTDASDLVLDVHEDMGCLGEPSDVSSPQLPWNALK